MSSVPIGYLFPALLLTWAMLYVVAAKGWPRFPRFLGFYFIVINELPFLALIWLAGSTWLAWSQGDLYSPVGWVAFGFCIVTTLGLVVVISWGLQTASTINSALDEGLGKQWRTAIDPKLAARVHSMFAASALLGPFAIRRWNVEHVTNISYGEAANIICWISTASAPGSPMLRCSSTSMVESLWEAKKITMPSRYCTVWPAMVGCASARITA